jgi:hypothetical protein
MLHRYGCLIWLAKQLRIALSKQSIIDKQLQSQVQLHLRFLLHQPHWIPKSTHSNPICIVNLQQIIEMPAKIVAYALFLYLLQVPTKLFDEKLGICINQIKILIINNKNPSSIVSSIIEYVLSK